LESGLRRASGVWILYLITGAVLAAVRIALLVWLNHRLATHVVTSMDDFIWQLYPEAVVGVFGGRLFTLKGAEYYVVWCSLFTVGSFVMATPILLVGWLRRRRPPSQPSQ
jgi:hypothetical protein